MAPHTDKMFRTHSVVCGVSEEGGATRGGGATWGEELQEEEEGLAM